ncbi:MAG: DegT/DnrJ/EryC1/StrS family aminotransferase [Treponema sp.]|jgi:dTDP-4-amino-4,6-dideoxygalactose transaminase|nr:DegT/DnrJ/EryC1/StrS family aminotransferase [Treponema sp.]
MEKIQNDLPTLEVGGDNIVLFHPHIPKNAVKYVTDTLSTRWIGQGPKVEQFENEFSKKFCNGQTAVAVGSGTDALHLSYILSGLKPGDEIISPVFTCTATNIPFLYMGVKVVFADVDKNTLNISVDHVRELINERTKAIVCVHYAGLPCDMDELNSIAKKWNIPVIEDAAHALGASYKGIPIGAISDFTMFSFQAIKHITTGDGGMVSLNDQTLRAKAERIRWFGIDRTAKQEGHWDNDIKEVGYKYQMTDIAAALGLAGLEEFDNIIAYRRKLFSIYEKELQNIAGLTFIGGGFKDREHAAWLCTVVVERRVNLQKMLREHHIESNQVHYRNDRYSIFGRRRDNLPNMDTVEDKYLILPLHTKVREEEVYRICEIIKGGW